MDQTPNTMPPLLDVRRRKFTIPEYHRMAEVGILAPDERVELIEGDIVEMPALGGPHVMAVIRLTRLLVRATSDRAKPSGSPSFPGSPFPSAASSGHAGPDRPSERPSPAATFLHHSSMLLYAPSKP